MKLSVVGTLRILRLMYKDKIIDKSDFINALKKLRETGFQISDSVIDKAIQGLQ
jgi:predicted nucleic acid-binding protein